jgi:hypothetical protein
MFFCPAQIVNRMDKKKHACRYVDIDTADLWESIPEFDVAQNFEESNWLFINSILDLNPSTSGP